MDYRRCRRLGGKECKEGGRRKDSLRHGEIE